jgi:hypothetical protein
MELCRKPKEIYFSDTNTNVHKHITSYLGIFSLPNGNSTQVLFTFAEDAAQLIFLAFEVRQQNSEDTFCHRSARNVPEPKNTIESRNPTVILYY